MDARDGRCGRRRTSMNTYSSRVYLLERADPAKPGDMKRVTNGATTVKPTGLAALKSLNGKQK